MSEELPLSSLAQPVEKFTNWKIQPSLQDLKQDLMNARQVQQLHIGKINTWVHNLKITGPAVVKARKGRSSVQPKLIRKQAEWRYTALSEPFLASEKLFSISPRTWEDGHAARQNELVVNWQFETKLNQVHLVDQYVRKAVDEGTVVVRVGWCRETKMEWIEAPVYGFFPSVDPKQVEALSQAAALKSDNPNAYRDLAEDIRQAVDYSLEVGQPHVAKLLRTERVQREKVLKNEPTAEIFETANLFVDPSCQGDPDKALYMVITWEATMGILKKDGRYKNLDAVNWGGASPLAVPDHVTNTPQEFQFKDQSRQKAVVTEYWGLYDIEGDGELTPIVVAWIGDIMIRCEKNPFPDGKPPFVIVPFMPIDGSIYGEPDGELLEDNQKILGAVTRGIIDLMARSANGQRGMAKNMLDVTNRKKFDDGQDYEFNPNIHPSNGIIEHKFPEIPGSAMNMVNLQNIEAESLTGVKMFSNEGVTGASLGPTAAGARGALDAASKRETGILRRLAKGWALVGQKIVAMNQEFMSEEEVIQVTNAEFITVRRDELAGNFNLKVEISTAEEDEAKATRLEFMLQTLGPNADIEMTKLILQEIARLRRMPELAHQIKNFQPQPNPLEEEKLKLEIEELRSNIAKNLAQAKAYEAQALAAVGQANLSNAKADTANLDFVEQESGVKHAREIDKTSQQAEANKNLEVTKGILSRKPNPDGGVDGPDDDSIAAAVGFNQLTKVGT